MHYKPRKSPPIFGLEWFFPRRRGWIHLSMDSQLSSEEPMILPTGRGIFGFSFSFFTLVCETGKLPPWKVGERGEGPYFCLYDRAVQFWPGSIHRTRKGSVAKKGTENIRYEVYILNFFSLSILIYTYTYLLKPRMYGLPAICIS